MFQTETVVDHNEMSQCRSKKICRNCPLTDTEFKGRSEGKNKANRKS